METQARTFTFCIVPEGGDRSDARYGSVELHDLPHMGDVVNVEGKMYPVRLVKHDPTGPTIVLDDTPVDEIGDVI